MQQQTKHPDATTTLIERATAGDEDAFADLYRDHAGVTWRLAYALTGTTRDAVEVTVESFARAFTALRADRPDRPDFTTLVLRSTRESAIDVRRAHGDSAPPFEAREETLVLATAFATLPERWRSALWLSEVEGRSTGEVAPVIGVVDRETARVTARARRGLREQYLRADLADTATRTCERAVTRLGPYVAGTLPADDIEKLERHLRLCDQCADRHAALATISDRLALLAPPLPAMLEDDVRLAWAGAVASASTGLGISALGEKLLAGVAAVAAGISVVGAAIVSVSDSGVDAAVAPIAPLVTELAAPRPDDIDLTIDLDPSGFGPGSVNDPDAERDGVVAARGGRGPVVADSGSGALDPTRGVSIDGNASPTPSTNPPTTTPPPPGTDAPAAPLVSVGTDVAGVPVAVEVSDTPGLTVGPIALGSSPQPGTSTVTVGGALDPLSPIVDPIDQFVGGLLGG